MISNYKDMYKNWIIKKSKMVTRNNQKIKHNRTIKT